VLVPLALFWGGAWSVGAALCEGPLSVCAEASSAGRCGAGRSGAGEGAGKGGGSLPTLVAALLSTSVEKLSLDCDGSGRAGLCGAV
jgi:hypothetical protein